MCRFDPQALTSLTIVLGLDYSDFSGFDPQALTSLTKAALSGPEKAVGFDPQALTSLTRDPDAMLDMIELVSIHRLLRA